MPKSWLPPDHPQADLVGVIAQVRSGAMTPEQAEEWAKANGRDAFVPPTDKLAPQLFAERYWPFALAMSRIATREEKAAARLWAAYKTWGPRQFELDKNLAEGRESLLKELRKGAITANGRPEWRATHSEIPVIAGLDLRLVRYGGHDRFCRTDGSVAYFDIVVDGLQTQTIWPKRQPGEVKVQRTAASEAETLRELIEIMRERPNEPIPKLN